MPSVSVILALGVCDLDCVVTDFFCFTADGASPLHCALYAQVSSWQQIDSVKLPISLMIFLEGSYKHLGHAGPMLLYLTCASVSL